jgi:hypothetical protein
MKSFGFLVFSILVSSYLKKCPTKGSLTTLATLVRQRATQKTVREKRPLKRNLPAQSSHLELHIFGGLVRSGLPVGRQVLREALPDLRRSSSTR